MRAAPHLLAALALLLPLALLAGRAEAAPEEVRITVTPGTLRLAEGSRARVRIEGAGEVRPTVTASTGRIEALREIVPGTYEAEYVPPDSLDPQVAVITAWARGGFGWAPITLAGVREVVVSAPHRTLVSVEVAGETFGPVPATAAGRAVVRVAVPPGAHFATEGKRRIDLGVEERPLTHVVLDRTALDANTSATVTLRAVAVDERGAPRRGARLGLAASEGELSAPAEIRPGVFEARWTLAPGKVRDAVVVAEVAGTRRSVAFATLERVPGPPAAVRVEVDRDALRAGEGDELAVMGRVVDVAGNPTQARAKLVVSLGAGESARLLPDAVIEWQGSGGIYTGRVQVPRRRSGRQELELKMIAAGETATLAATRTVALLPGSPSLVKVEPEADLLADGRAREIRVTVLDQHGNRVELPGSPVVTATRGTLGSPARHAAGVYVLEYRSPLATADFHDVIRARVGTIEGTADVRVRARGAALVLAPKVGFTMGRGFQAPEAGAELGLWRRSLGASLGLVVDARVFAFGRTDALRAGTQALTVESEATFAALGASLALRRPFLRGMAWLGAGGGAVLVTSSASVAGQAKVTAQTWVPAAHASLAWGHPLGPVTPFGELRLAHQGDPARGPVRGALDSLTFNLGCRFDVL